MLRYVMVAGMGYGITWPFLRAFDIAVMPLHFPTCTTKKHGRRKCVDSDLCAYIYFFLLTYYYWVLYVHYIYSL